jgi:hypothetical protein
MRTTARARWTRLLLGAALAITVAVPAVVPAAAAGSGPVVAGSGRTWVVDDDGRATPARCSAKAEAPKRIQKAIDLAGPGDTILVCPGVYREEPVIQGAKKAGLTLRGTESWAAVLQPADGSTKVSAFRILSTTGVTVQGLRFLAPDLAPACINSSYALEIEDGRDITIRGNRFAPGAADPLGPCPLQNGITIAGRSQVRILYNAIRDARGLSVFSNDPTVTVRVARNSFRRSFDAQGMPFLAFNNGRATIVGNQVTGALDRTSPGFNISSTGSLLVKGNTFRNLETSLFLYQTVGARVIQNQVINADTGIFTSETTDSIVRGNRITAGTDSACLSLSDVNALWKDNLRTGGLSSPDEICPLAP